MSIHSHRLIDSKMENSIERDNRLRSEQEAREMNSRLSKIELWQVGHEVTCLGRYQAIQVTQKFILFGVIVAVAMGIPQAWPHLIEFMGWVK